MLEIVLMLNQKSLSSCLFKAMFNYCQYQEAQTEQALFVSLDWNNPQDFGESECTKLWSMTEPEYHLITVLRARDFPTADDLTFFSFPTIKSNKC